ncbi:MULTISPECIES: hypothetical protein [unclassified Methylobacterium]|uniref:hypothetical protein n=1 Tax=unclassified Methylobacterium TaxID=2615210 RepID=UPI0008F1C435|nr:MULTISPECIES: hypothetical protein [unclassified Methylobacterium]SFU67798.1 hypothetical protein SAMN02799643_01762 [Methylobacterium sp. UNCCL125]
MPAAIGAAVLGEIGLATLAASEGASLVVGYAILGTSSLGLTFTAIPDEETARDGAERDPAA